MKAWRKDMESLKKKTNYEDPVIAPTFFKSFAHFINFLFRYGGSTQATL